MSMNRTAFLRTIAVSEIGEGLMAKTDDGYGCIVGSTLSNPIIFTSYADHPRKLIMIRPGLWSSAAGRYQILAHYFDVYRQQLRLPDFGHASQDAIALQMIGECGALDDIDAGRISVAITKCKSRWASFPNAGYVGQHMNSMDDLIAAYQSSGGVMA